MNAYAPVIHMFPAIIRSTSHCNTYPSIMPSKFHCNTVLDRNQLLKKIPFDITYKTVIPKSSHISIMRS